MALLALGPFLHAHYGSSRLTGFHVDGMGAVSTSVQASADIETYVAPDSEEESAALGISTSHTRQSLSDDGNEENASPLWFLVTVLLSVGVATQSSIRGAMPCCIRPSRAYRAGFPPLAHAPPTARG
jgi:hypothetical protein